MNTYEQGVIDGRREADINWQLPSTAPKDTSLLAVLTTAGDLEGWEYCRERREWRVWRVPGFAEHSKTTTSTMSRWARWNEVIDYVRGYVRTSTTAAAGEPELGWLQGEGETIRERRAEDIRREERERILKLPLPIAESLEGQNADVRHGYGMAVADWATAIRGTKS